jgi:hypothetical protein
MILLVWMLLGLAAWTYYLFREKIYREGGFFGLPGYIGLILPLSLLLGPITFPVTWASLR